MNEGIRKRKGDIEWHVKGRKKPIAYSTKASSDLIKVLVEEHFDATISEIHGMIHFDEEAKSVLQKYIDLGLGTHKLFGKLI